MLSLSKQFFVYQEKLVRPALRQAQGEAQISLNHQRFQPAEMIRIRVFRRL